MISINVVFKKDDIDSLLIKGHANQNEHGKDIVCAGVSSIVYGSINAIDLASKDSITFIIDDGYTNIQVVNNNEKLQTLLQMMLVQLKTLEEAYPQYIKITQTHGGV